MSLSNLNKDNITRLFTMLELTTENHEMVESVRSNYSTYGKLELLSRQMMLLKSEAKNIIENHKMNLDFSNIKCGFKKVPGNFYYVYEKNNEKILSLLSPDDWHVCPGTFVVKVLYDYDHHFYVSK